MPPPNKPINVVSLAKTVLGTELSLQEGRGLVQEKLKQLCQGQLAVVDSVDSTTATTVYSSAEERIHLDSLWKFGMAEMMNYNMELLASRLGQSETAVSNVQSKISKQVMPVSYIRLYSLSSKTKTDYYKLPLDLLNGIKSAICMASHFNDSRTKNMFPSVNTVVDSAITQLFYDSRKGKPGWGIKEWQALAVQDGWCAPGTQSLLNLNNHIVGGHEYIPEGNASNFDIPIENECSEARDELDEVDVVTISETPKRSSERGLSQPPRKKIPKINRKLSIQRSSAFKMELTDSPTTQTERPSYTDLSGEKVQYQQYEVAAESSYPNGMMTQEMVYQPTTTLFDYSDPSNRNITKL
ncbi:hypothetical protein PRIPAC_86176 [Pristionchus pacificus]|uniref:Uncharacterized protein n=1 Tax=Pristionchus pacificus TaxID=54126 RepID=A0A2A6BLK3_PRIPA|nr:hypothetical protein PRIPAC_84465 [Pristionchus pacificus]KAF8368347.1 hypothetical protein PRIPAC_86176 [Pristionchus pacificus]|eukprot:PDM66728.1 hypothetical protein PRIPAC_48145 [Pristionchus pacificus]